MATELRSASFQARSNRKLPKGAKVIDKTTRIEVEEIENGFITSKSTDVKFEIQGSTDYMYITKKYFSKENPLNIDLDEKSLADNFD